MAETLLEVVDLKKYFPISSGLFDKVVGHVKAVDGVSFALRSGECLALVGESGSGKTTVGRTLLRAYQPTGGQVSFHLDGEAIDVMSADEEELKGLRRHMQMIFQDPYASLNPRMTVFEIVGEPLLVHGIKDGAQREERVRQLMDQVGLNPQHMRRYPHAFSGGQRQRIAIGCEISPRSCRGSAENVPRTLLEPAENPPYEPQAKLPFTVRLLRKDVVRRQTLRLNRLE